MILTKESIQEIKEKAVKYPRKKSAILPALTVAYRQLGYVDAEVYRDISKVIGVPYVEIAEAATFYTMFPKKPRGKYLIQVCHNISCALLGADSLIEYLEQKLGIEKFTYVGHSTSGLIGIRLASTHRDIVKAMVLVAPAAARGGGKATWARPGSMSPWSPPPAPGQPASRSGRRMQHAP